MISENTGWIESRFARLSTGLKMLLILSLGLFPLGLIAVLASIQSAQQNRHDRDQEIEAKAELIAQRLNATIARNALTIRAASTAVAATNSQSAVCQRTLARLAVTQMVRGSFALFGEQGRLRCASPGFQPPVVPLQGAPNRSDVLLSEGSNALRFILYGQNGQIEGIGEFAQPAVSELAVVPGDRSFNLVLLQADRAMTLHRGYRSVPLTRTVAFNSPVAGGQLKLRMMAAALPISATELLLILLPVVMWMSAAMIGWLIVDRLLLKPLVRMQQVVSAYKPGDRHLDIPSLSTPAREIGELGAAFDQVTRTVARHEAELEAAVERQTRLVREVHHRVKNNLQVVASLLNLHSRGSRSEDVAAAYASIQRRVDALAVVHRNHYAELEENRGVALKPLISELAANLRATAPASSTHMMIGLNIGPYYVTQDVAVSVAFLITEIVEFAMFASATSVHISLSAGAGATALLSVESDSLRAETASQSELFERFDRIITGLSRQLRSTIQRDAGGTYSLAIAVMPEA